MTIVLVGSAHADTQWFDDWEAGLVRDTYFAGTRAKNKDSISFGRVCPDDGANCVFAIFGNLFCKLDMTYPAYFRADEDMLDNVAATCTSS
jgi:hypothetical protein